jgi:hypothetical protein
MKKEHTLVLELCKFLNPDKEKIRRLLEPSTDYPLVLGSLLFNRMGAVAYHTLKECELLGCVNREFRNTLKSVYETGVEQTKSFQNALGMVNQIFNEFYLPYAFLKGAYLVSLYPDGLRTSNDIDILTEYGNITLLCSLLNEAGFSQGHIRNGEFVPASRPEIIHSMINRGETIPFVKKINMPKMEFCEVDLNFSVDYKPEQNSNVVSGLLENSRRLKTGGLIVFSPVDFLIHLCLHLYKEAAVIAWVEMNRDLSLYKFCDIYLLVNKWMDENFHREIKDRIFEFGLQKECYYALFHTKTLFGIKNKYLQKLLSDIEPQNTLYLKEVLEPKKNKRYRHEQSFTNWFFNNNRKGSLHEVTDENA